jgi:hypothetical protein
MDVSTLEELKDEYPTSSWALWSPDFPNDGCVEEDAAELFEYIKITGPVYDRQSSCSR